METLDYDSSPRVPKWNSPTYWSTFAMYTCVGWLITFSCALLFHVGAFSSFAFGFDSPLPIISAALATPPATIGTFILRHFRKETGIAVAILLGLLPTPLVFAVGCFLAR